MKRPTLNSLSAELGVSRQTVSNVINAPHKVRPDTRRRVQEAIDRAGYRPSAAARALRIQRSMTIGMRLRPTSDGINGAVVDGFLHALVESADAKGYRLLLFTAKDTGGELGQIQSLLESKSIDGVVLTDTDSDDPRPAALVASGTPFATFGRPWGSEEAHSWVDVDGRAGTFEAVQHLRSLGHERIGFIGWPGPSGVGDDRRAGWAAAMGLAPEDEAELLETTTDAVANGAAAMRRLLERGIKAVVCASDSLALGALSELRADNHGDAAVVGYDDTPVARAMGLSSVRQPVEQAAETVLELVLAQLANPNVKRSQVLLTPTLMPRRIEDFVRSDKKTRKEKK